MKREIGVRESLRKKNYVKNRVDLMYSLV